MRYLLLWLFFFCASIQAAPSYYVFGAAEDDCVINRVGGKTHIEGEACLCIQVSAQSEEPWWKLDWNSLSCHPQASTNIQSSSDCTDGGCSQRQCLEVLYDTQHGETDEVSEVDCLQNQLPLLP